MKCERCERKCYFGYIRLLNAQRVLLCYKCAKIVDLKEKDNGCNES